MSKSLLDGILGSYAVKDENGDYNVEQTISKFATEFTVFVEMQAKDNERITEVVNTELLPLYTANPKLVLNTEGAIGLIAMKVGYTADTFVPLKKRIADVLKNDNHFWTNRGPGAGLHYMPDGSEEYTAFLKDGMNPGERIARANEQVKELKKQLKSSSKSSQ